MKIVYFSDLLLFSIGGVSNSLLNLSAALQKNGHKIAIFAPKSDHTKTNNLNGISVDFFPSIAASWNPRLRIGSPLSPAVFSKTKKFNPDIVHFHTPFLIGTNAIILGKSLKKPVVGTFHTYFMQPEYLKAAGVNIKADSFTNFLWKYASFFYNQCDAVIAPSESVRKDLKKYGVEKPIYTISNPINESQFKIVDEKQLRALKTKLKLSRKVVLYVGRLSHEKSLDILLKSFAKVAEKIDDVSLLFIGDGQIKSELKSLAQTLGIGDRVVFAGSIEPQALLSQGYYQLADVFVTASGSETQGMSLIEAMYFGLPLVGVAKKGVFDMVNRVGLLSPPNNINSLAENIGKVLTNDSLRKKLGKVSQNTFNQKYSTEKIVSHVEKLYRKLTKS